MATRLLSAGVSGQNLSGWLGNVMLVRHQLKQQQCIEPYLIGSEHISAIGLAFLLFLCISSGNMEEMHKMQGFGAVLAEAFDLIAAWDPALVEIVGLSLRVTLTAVIIACVIGLPLGAAAGAFRFPGRTLTIVVLNAMMGLPPVAVGLFVYLMLSASGPLGVLGLLYTPSAMIIAQTILITPIIAALTRQVVEDLNNEYAEQFASLGVRALDRLGALLWDARFALLTVALAGFGRAVAEVGAVIIVGGNINHVTRVITTTIALETSKGNLQLALALGVILLILALVVNAAVMAVRASAGRATYA